MKEPVADFVIRNITGVKNCSSKTVATQTSAVAVTRAAARATNDSKPLRVSSIPDLLNSDEIITEQECDPKLALIRKQAVEGTCRKIKRMEASIGR